MKNSSIVPADLPGAVFADLPSQVREQAALRPTAPAITDGNTVWSWADLAERMDAVAGVLAGRGIGRGDVVATFAGNSAAHVAAYLGTVACGAGVALVALGAHETSVAAMIGNAGANLVLADDPTSPGLQDAEVRAIDAFVTGAEVTATPNPRRACANDLMDVLYSSGTTGEPKGIEHDHLFRFRQNVRFGNYGFDANAVTLVSTPFYSNTTMVAVLPTLAGGGHMVLQRRFREAEWLELAERHHATHAMLVPVQTRRLLSHPRFDATNLTSFHTRLSTSAPFPPDLVREALARFPGRLVNIYGMTEGGVGTMLDCTARPDKLHTVGQPVLAAEIRLIDGNGQPVAPGEPGEIVGRSSTMMRGYRDAPDRTARALWTSPEGNAFIRSGDMGRFDGEGFLVLLDRQKDMILSGGFNVFAIDLETALLEHPDVVEAAVIAVPSERWGETPLGLVVGRTGIEPDLDTILEATNAQLGKTQRLSTLELRKTLPRNDIGKVLKRELRAHYWPG